MESGMLAAEAIIEKKLSEDENNDLENYQLKYEKSRSYNHL